jgi:GTP-binding protein Era
MSDPTRCAIVAIIGAPNAGKSTLVNAIVGQKVAIVTHKAQTTRTMLRGVAMRGQTQLILIDTPGVFSPKRRLDRAMVQAAWTGAGDADAIVHLVDPTALNDGDPITVRLKEQGKTAILALNKVDIANKTDLLDTARRYSLEGPYTDVFMVSATTGNGVEDLVAFLSSKAPVGPWLFGEDQASDAPSATLAAEITREKLMLRLHDELPYEATVEPESWKERGDGSVEIHQTIFVARESQKKIAIGADGGTVKAIGTSARKELEDVFDRRVHLFLHVRVRENWADERARFNALGLNWDA